MDAGHRLLGACPMLLSPNAPESLTACVCALTHGTHRFDYGVVVCWSLDSQQEQAIIKMLRHCQVRV